LIEFTLRDLEQIIANRAKITDGSSYTASLVKQGMLKASKKLGEEAVETVIASLAEDREHLINESADLLYHIMVVWNIAGIELDDVLEILAARTQQTGFEEKASRNHD